VISFPCPGVDFVVVVVGVVVVVVDVGVVEATANAAFVVMVLLGPCDDVVVATVGVVVV